MDDSVDEAENVCCDLSAPRSEALHLYPTNACSEWVETADCVKERDPHSGNNRTIFQLVLESLTWTPD